MGLRQVGDLLGLPRAGLARRFGETLLAEIDAAFGRRPDPREAIVPARLFESRLELFARADSTEQVLHGASILLARLVAWLAAQHAFVRRFRLLMHHETRWQQGDRTPQATALEIALAEPSRDSEHLLVLLRERLAQVQLPAPTLEIALAGRGHRQARRAEQRAVPDPAERERRPDAPDRAAAGAPRRRIGCSVWPASRTIGPSGRAGGSAPTRACGRHARRGAAARQRASPTSRAAMASSSAATFLCVAAGLAAAGRRAARRAALAAAARRPAAQPVVGARADRGRLVGRRARRARLLHRRGRRRRAGLDLPRAIAAVSGGRERKRLVSSRPLRIRTEGAKIPSRDRPRSRKLRAFSGALRRSA